MPNHRRRSIIPAPPSCETNVVRSPSNPAEDDGPRREGINNPWRSILDPRNAITPPATNLPHSRPRRHHAPQPSRRKPPRHRSHNRRRPPERSPQTSPGREIPARALTRIFGHVAHRTPSPFNAGRSFAPPALFIGLRDGETTREPQQDVIVRRACLRELKNPDTTESDASTLGPLPDVFQEAGHITGVIIVTRCIGQSDHSRPEPMPPIREPILHCIGS